MAGGKIVGITIDIEGKTSGLTKSLQEANSAISKTTAALKDVDKALELDPSNVELMAQKEQLLAKQIEQTNDKLEIMKQVAEDANEALARGDISQEQYASLTAEIAKTDAALGELENEANGSGDAMEEVGDNSEVAAGELGEVATESENAGVGLDAMKAAAIAVGTEMVAALGACVSAIKEVGGALVDATVAAGDYADEIHTLEQKTGIAAERLQEMNYVTGLIDVSVETMTGAMTKMEKSMGSAADKIFNLETTQAELNRQLKEGKITADDYEAAMEEALSKNATGYDQLGISIYDANHNLRDSEEVFWEVIDALGKMESGTERDLLAMELLGKSAKELNPLIEAGSDKFNELAQEAHDVGYVMSDETLDAFQEFDDQMERMGKSGEAAKNALGTVLLPMLGDLGETATDALSEFSVAMQNSGGDIDKMGEAITSILPKVLQAVNKVAPKLFKLLGDVVNTLLQVLIDNLPEFVDTAMSILEALTNTLITPENITKIANAATTIVMSLMTYITQNLDKILSAALMIVQSLLEGLRTNLPVIIPAAIEAILTFAETLLAPENLEILLGAILEITMAVAMAIIDDLPEIIESLVTIVTNIVEFLLSPEGMGQIAEAGFKMFVALVEKLPEIIGDILGGVGEIVDGILNAFGFEGGLGQRLGEIWETIWNVIKGVINLVIGGLNGFTSAIESAVNFFVDGINVLVDGANSLVGWIPGVSSHIIPNLPHMDIPDIPELAQGAVIGPNNPFLAVLGDQSSGVNIEAPLDTIKQAVAEVAGFGDKQIVIPVYIGYDRIETIIAKANTNLNFISGGR